ncbi:MAG: hypothetical protein H6680_09290 [Desulfobacteraceae bacterium]|nr:hypothetical protein [Desulfobacteraceae bacterium]
MDNLDITKQMADIKGLAEFDKGFEPFWLIAGILVSAAVILLFFLLKKIESKKNQPEKILYEKIIIDELEKIKTDLVNDLKEKWTGLFIVFKKYLGLKLNSDFSAMSEKEIMRKTEGIFIDDDYEKILRFLNHSEKIRFSDSKVYDRETFDFFYLYLKEFIVSDIKNLKSKKDQI